MSFDEVLDQVRNLLQARGRLGYRALKRRFTLDDEFLEDIKHELIKAERVAADEDGEVLVWTGGEPSEDTSSQPVAASAAGLPAPAASVQPEREPPADGRRQLTVMFCDLVGSTALSEQLDPEELQMVVRTYQDVSARVIKGYQGHIAQYLGDGLLVYFGYPVAHEDDGQRAIRTGLEIVEVLQQVPLLQHHGVRVRIGIHTGLVVIGEIGGSEKREMLALGETPNLVARLQGLAAPNTVVLSDATQRLVTGLFDCEELGLQSIKGLATSVHVYRAKGESDVRSRLEVASRRGLTPLIGREHEVQLLLDRWEQAKAGAGQVVLLTGEPGIGKSRLVYRMKEQGTTEGVPHIEFRCSPFLQNTAFAPVVEHLQRLLQFTQEDTPASKLAKLQQTLSRYRFPQADTLPLFASLLSLPQPEAIPPLTLSPQKQKQKTQEALVAWLVEEAEQQAVVVIWEDLHWADPSTLELLTLLLDQIPTTRLFMAMTARPEFRPPWASRAYIMLLALNRLPRAQTAVMVRQVMGEATALKEVVEQIVAKTDGVPLFIEELTKSVMESVGITHASPLQLAIPATLHDSLMARLDRLGPAKEIAQLGATIGREFRYDLLQAVAVLDEATLQSGLKQLVEAELIYQRGLPPQAQYTFKHALIQDTAYQSLLKSTRQQYHTQIAQVLAERFPDTKANQPELLAHHYTEAGQLEQALPYWQRAGDQATQRSAHAEVIAHIMRGLELLQTLPDTPVRARHELLFQTTLGPALVATRGFATPEVGTAYMRARDLCQQLGETPQLFAILGGLWQFHACRSEYQTARDLGEQLLTLAQREQNLPALVVAHGALGQIFFCRGEWSQAQTHFAQSLLHYDSQHHQALTFLCGGEDTGVASQIFMAWGLWLQGYPDQALERVDQAFRLAEELDHPFSLAEVLFIAAEIHQCRGEGKVVQERAEALMALSNEQGFALFVPFGSIMRGWALVVEEQREEEIIRMRQGLEAYHATGMEMFRPHLLALLAEAYGKMGQVEEGLRVLVEVLEGVSKTEQRFYEADLYRLKGELTLQLATRDWGVASGSSSLQVLSFKSFVPKEAEQEAEGYFLKAIEVAQKQHAKSLELRAVMSLARLWQQQEKKNEARHMLAEIYEWFTEGFDTKDLQEAKALLEGLT